MKIILSIFTIAVIGLIPPIFAGNETESFSVSSVIEQSLDPLYQPTVNTLSELGISLAQSATLIAGFLIAIFIGWIAGRFVERVTRSFIKRIFEHDKVIRAMGMERKDFEKTDWSQVHKLIPFTVKWFIYIIFFVVAVDILQVPEASEALAQLYLWIPRLVTFIVLVSVGFVVVRIALKWMVDTRPALFGEKGSIVITKGIVQGIIYAVIFGIGITTLGIGSDIIPILFWVILSGIMGMGIVLSFGFRNIIKGWLLSESLKKDNLVVKDAEIKVGDFAGTVLDITNTHIKMKMGDKIILIPNARLEDTIIEITKEPSKKEI